MMNWFEELFIYGEVAIRDIEDVLTLKDLEELSEKLKKAGVRGINFWKKMEIIEDI